MCLQLGSALFLLQLGCYAFSRAEAASEPDQRWPQLQQQQGALIQGAPIASPQARAARIAEFVSSHKIPDGEAAIISRRRDYGSYEEVDASPGLDPRRRGRLYEQQQQQQQQQQLLDGGVRLSSENPTTMLPTLTTPREQQQQLFDFVPVNKIRDDAKGDIFSPYHNKNFEDVGDVSLVPAGSNTRIQVKKGPNGKDYEYEYVYYYYDEDEEGGKQAQGQSSRPSQAPQQAAATSPNGAAAPRRGASSQPSQQQQQQRAKYNAAPVAPSEPHSSTPEPALVNEIVPAAAQGSRARQIEPASVTSRADLADDRLPPGTRFPARGRASQISETTERASRSRGNRQRQQSEAVDSRSFRGSQEGPEFPRSFPDGPYRFIGVTPNEGLDEKAVVQARGRLQRIQEPAPVQENYEEPGFRKHPASGAYAGRDDGNSARQQQSYNPRVDDFGAAAPVAPSRVGSYVGRTSAEEREANTESATGATDVPTTQFPRAMEKVALDLYAYVQQGRSNLVDFVRQADDQSGEGTDSSADQSTELPLGGPAPAADSDDTQATVAYPTTTPEYLLSPGSVSTARSTIVTFLPTTTTTTTTTTTLAPTSAPSEEPSIAQTSFGRAKLRRPLQSAPGSSTTTTRSRFKPNSSGSTTEASVVEASSTQRTRARFGNASSGVGGSNGFKASKSAGTSTRYKAVDEPSQKDTAEKSNVEPKSTATTRGRYRGGSSRVSPQARTTAAPEKTPNSPAPSTQRPASLNKLTSANRRRPGRPGALAPAPVDENTAEQPASATSPPQESTASEQQRPLNKVSSAATAPRPKPLAKPIIKQGVPRLNPRLKPGQQTTTSEAIPSEAGSAVEQHAEEPVVEGTEEESREAPVETSPATKSTPAGGALNNKLRQRNKLQVQPKTTTARTTLAPASRRSHLLPPRRTTTEPAATVAESAFSPADESLTEESEAQAANHESHGAGVATTSEAPHSDPSGASKTEHENPRSLSSLLAPRRKPLTARKPGQPFHSHSTSGAAAGEQ